MINGLVVHSVQKDGNDIDENEDRAAHAVSDREVRVAVADGATEATFSDLWAEALVTESVETPRFTGLSAEVLERAERRWRSYLPAEESLPWYAQAKLQEGSYSTLAVLNVRRRQAGYSWQSWIVGDCEIFVLKTKGTIRRVRSVPIARSAEFGYHPELVPTRPERWSALRAGAYRGLVTPPFEIWVVTDALAHSCLAEEERGRPIWNAWAEASSSSTSFSSQVDLARHRGEMRNDDVTMVRLWVT